MASQDDPKVKRRGLLQYGALFTAFTGGYAISALSTDKGSPSFGDELSPVAYVPVAEKGAPGGVANLDGNGKILATQLPDPSGSYPGVVALKGDGIDPTGIMDSTAAIQAKLNTAANKHAYLPPGTFKVAGTITLAGERTMLHGPGILSWSAGIENSPALLVTGRGTVVDGVTLINPFELGAQTGHASSGLQIQAHDVIVTNCLIDSFQTGIHVYQNGEWMDIVIANNRIKDVLGSGDGPINPVSDRGEDRGDGIMVTGAGVSITGNVVNAKAGRDARIGIHCESLTDQAPNHPDGENRSFTIAGNIITGPFRRSIATEDVSNAAITGNACADATWWGISVSGTCHGITVSGNSLVWTMPAGQTPGLAWRPETCCFQILNGVKGVTFADNTVTLKGTSKSVIRIEGGELGRPDNVTIAGNVFQCDGGAYEVGVSASAGTGDVNISGNIIEGFLVSGLSISGVSGVIVTNNYIDGVTAGASNHWGILSDGTTKGGVIATNRVNNVHKGVERANSEGGAVITSNEFRGCFTAIDLYATSNALVTNNAFISCPTAIANANGTNVTSPNATVP
ncbi:right-handed parallel beta-helix repeat-containing protein [Arthrobacter sp. Z4-13]